MTIFKSLIFRLYEDFLMPSRFNEYRLVLEGLRKAGYQFVPIRDYWSGLKIGEYNSTNKIVLLRHDIDTDSQTARKMWEIERSLGIKSSYYFRLKTIDIELMRQIENDGGESGYHYEEIASFAKKYALRTPADVQNHFSEIRKLFIANLSEFRSVSGLPVRTVASHGDFVNRKLGMPNWLLLSDYDLRSESGIELEVYDKEFVNKLDIKITDGVYPSNWKPVNPLSTVTVETCPRVICLLVHPRHWRSNFKVNLMDNLNRLVEGISYKN